MKYSQTLRSENCMTDMESRGSEKGVAAVVAWMTSSLTFLVGDCSALWAIRAEVGTAGGEERT